MFEIISRLIIANISIRGKFQVVTIICLCIIKKNRFSVNNGVFSEFFVGLSQLLRNIKRTYLKNTQTT